jgi:zinc transporter
MDRGARMSAPIALLLDGSGGARPLTADEADRWRADDGPLWLRLDPQDAAASVWLAGNGALSDEERQTLLRRTTQTRVQRTGDRVLVAVAVPSESEDDLHTLRMSLEPRMLITIFHGELPVLDRAAALLAGHEGARDVPALLAGIVQMATTRSELEALELDERMVDLECQADDGDAHRSLERMQIIQRASGQARRRMARLRDVSTQLRHGGPPWLLLGREPQWEGLAARHGDVMAMLDALQERTRGLYDDLQGRLSTALDERVYILTLISAIVLPVSLVTGLLGVNVGGVPLREAPWAFGALCLLIALMVVVQYRFLRRRRWLRQPESMRSPPASEKEEEPNNRLAPMGGTPLVTRQV